MKKSLSRVIIALATLLIPNITNAASSCSYKEQVELNDLVANVKASYEYGERVIKDGAINADTNEYFDVTEGYFTIKIANITDQIYVKITSDGFNQTYYYKDSNNGLVEFVQNTVYEIKEYKIDVYSNNSSCRGELYRTFKLKLPKFNPYSQVQICKTYPNYRYCQRFLDTDVNVNEEFYKGLDEYEKLHQTDGLDTKKKENKFLKFYKEHALIINITTGVLVASGVATTVILVKRKRSRVL